MGAHARYVLDGTEATRPRKLRAADRGLVSKWAKAKGGQREWAVGIRSGSSANSYGAWSFELSVDPEPTPAIAKKFFEALAAASPGAVSRKPATDASYVGFTVPVRMLLPDPAPFRDLVLEAASSLPFRSGHAGFGLAYNDLDPEDERDEQLAAWNARYRGIDAGSPDCSASFASSRIRGVSWLTLVDAGLLAEVGGRKALDALGRDIVVHELPHGVAIQAGAAPRLGDVNEEEDMSPYVKVNRLLAPIRAEEMHPPTAMSNDDARAWLRRFDRG
jgi:hypothetical protein